MDAFRGKQRSALQTSGIEDNDIPAHLEVRPGKRRWHARAGQVAQSEPTPKASDETA